MDKKELNLEEYVDQRRWLLNNGLVTEDVQNQLFFCGSIVHKEIQAVELKIEAEKRTIHYHIYVNEDLLKKITKYHTLSKSDGLFDLWCLKRLIKKEGSLDFQLILNSFVKDFCGPQWKVVVNIVDFGNYVETLGENNELTGASQQSNKLSD